jgi:homoprotocatechuate degradation regulator HpaR
MSSLSRFSDSLPMLLLRAREQTLAHFRPLLKRDGVTEQQWRVLRALADGGAMTASGLARECAILAPSMTRILRKLTADGLVEANRSAEDQRELRVGISPRGRQLVASLAPHVEQEYDRIRTQLTPERLERLEADLQRLIELEAQSPD